MSRLRPAPEYLNPQMLDEALREGGAAFQLTPEFEDVQVVQLAALSYPCGSMGEEVPRTNGCHNRPNDNVCPYTWLTDWGPSYSSSAEDPGCIACLWRKP